MREAVRGEPSLQPRGPGGSNIHHGQRGMREGAGKTSDVWGLRFPEPQTGGRLGWESGEPRAGCADREAFKGQMVWICLRIPWAKSSPQAARLVFSAPTSARIKSRCPPSSPAPTCSESLLVRLLLPLSVSPSGLCPTTPSSLPPSAWNPCAVPSLAIRKPPDLTVNKSGVR